MVLLAVGAVGLWFLGVGCRHIPAAIEGCTTRESIDTGKTAFVDDCIEMASF